MRSARKFSGGLLIALSLCAIVLAGGCAGNPPADRPASREEWVEQTLASMSLEEKLGQMIMSRAYGYYVSAETDEYRRLEHLVRDRRFGGLVFFQGDVLETATAINRLQRLSRVPLLIASDFEWGTAMRIRRGTRFPEAMAVGATRDSGLAYNLGFAIGREARAMGVHMVLAPDADVNSNPENPVINTRSFGEDPELVAMLSSAFSMGVRAAGAIATAKHFPGHGDTRTDSHVDLPIVDVDRQRLDAVELLPYRRLIADGIQSIMVAHLLIPVLEGNGLLPATLSRAVIGGVLKHELGFDGLVVTDALDMGAIINTYGSDSAAVFAVEAGVDILLIPADEDVAINALLRAVTSGRIPLARVEQSVRKILRTKFDLGLDRNRLIDPEAIPSTIGVRKHLALARSIARASITAVRNGSAIPLDRGMKGKPIAVVFADAENYRTEVHRPTYQWPNEPVGDYFLSQLRRRFGPVESIRIDPSANSMDIDSMMRRASTASMIIAPVFSRARSGSGKSGLSPSLIAAAESLATLAKPTIVIAMGSPYTLAAFDSAATLLCAYSDCEASTDAVIDVLIGESGARGRLPVTIPGQSTYGEGLMIGQEYLRRDPPEALGINPSALAAIDTLMMEAIRDSVFPGAQLAVIRNGVVVINGAYGAQEYDPSSPAIGRSTLYDLASVTKVIATTPAIMKLVEDSLVSLDEPVVTYIPEFGNRGKEKITVRNLLLHNGGLPAFKRLFLTCNDASEAMDSVYQTELVYRPGDSTIYSDFDFILLGEIVRRVSGMPLNRYVDSVYYKPLGLGRTMFTPQGRMQKEAAPTEYDSVYRHTLVRGIVHDENAFLLGGVSGHAGLFSTASDLSVFIQMFINGGSYGGRRYLSATTVRDFTTRQSMTSSRALGWDMKSLSGYTSAGALMGPGTYGHTGFTGTSVWIDPDQNLGVILLTNRVFPTRANGRISAFRPRLHDAVLKVFPSISGIPPPKR